MIPQLTSTPVTLPTLGFCVSTPAPKSTSPTVLCRAQTRRVSSSKVPYFAIAWQFPCVHRTDWSTYSALPWAAPASAALCCRADWYTIRCRRFWYSRRDVCKQVYRQFYHMRSAPPNRGAMIISPSTVPHSVAQHSQQVSTPNRVVCAIWAWNVTPTYSSQLSFRARLVGQ